MIHTINITTKTRLGDAYPEVAINAFPIIYIDDEDVDNILDDQDLIASISKHIKNKSTYNSAILNIKTLTDDLEGVTTKSFRLKEHINLPEWQ